MSALRSASASVLTGSFTPCRGFGTRSSYYGRFHEILRKAPSQRHRKPAPADPYTGVRAQDGRLAVFTVWPSAARSFDFDGVSESHRLAAEGAEALLFPAGEAWREAWSRDPDLSLYGPDGFHPSPPGTYLAALVMYQQIAGRAPSSLPDGMVGPGGLRRLPEGVSAFLHEAAPDANAASALPR